MLVNTTDQEVDHLTRSSCRRSRWPCIRGRTTASPSPGAARWRGRCASRGGVTDADPQVRRRHRLGHRPPHGRRPQRTGVRRFPQRRRAAASTRARAPTRLTAVEVEPGDGIELLVLPKANYICDTTIVDLTIALADGSQGVEPGRRRGGRPARRTARAIRTPTATATPACGISGTWPTAAGDRAGRPTRRWRRGTARPPATGSRGRGARRPREFQKAFTTADAGSPFWIKNAEDEKALPAETRDRAGPDARAKLDALQEDAGAAAGVRQRRPGRRRARQPARRRPRRAHPPARPLRPARRSGAAPLPRDPGRRQDQKPITQGSGRLELAEWLTRPDNPLTARVMVNRIWQHHFGEGIVATPSNFGKLGDRPSASRTARLPGRPVREVRLVDQGHAPADDAVGDVPASRARDEKSKADPENRLFGRMNRRRLEAEARPRQPAGRGRPAGPHGGRPGDARLQRRRAAPST